MWKGSAFDCTKSDNEIVLLHSHFGSDEGTHRTCNNGSIIGEAIKVEENYYTSQLHVTVSPDMIGERIECANDGSTMEIEPSTIMATTGICSYYYVTSIMLVSFPDPTPCKGKGSGDFGPFAWLGRLWARVPTQLC